MSVIRIKRSEVGACRAHRRSQMLKASENVVKFDRLAKRKLREPGIRNKMTGEVFIIPNTVL